MRISIITSSRADFGLLKNLILEIKKEKKFLTSIIASGSHFTKQFGNSSKEIIKTKELRSQDNGKASGQKLSEIFDQKNEEIFWKDTKFSLKDRKYVGLFNESLHMVNQRANDFLGSFIEHYFFNS